MTEAASIAARATKIIRWPRFYDCWTNISQTPVPMYKAYCHKILPRGKTCWGGLAENERRKIAEQKRIEFEEVLEQIREKHEAMELEERRLRNQRVRQAEKDRARRAANRLTEKHEISRREKISVSLKGIPKTVPKAKPHKWNTKRLPETKTDPLSLTTWDPVIPRRNILFGDWLISKIVSAEDYPVDEQEYIVYGEEREPGCLFDYSQEG